MSYLMDYGDDWPPPPERQRMFGRAFWAEVALYVGAFLLIAVPTVISDHLPLHLRMPVTSSTATPRHT
jgi:hypothetical protein